MDAERDSRSEQGAPLPGFGEAAPHDRDRTDQRQTGQGQADRSATTPAHGIRHVQRLSNWMAAALMVGTCARLVAGAGRPASPGPMVSWLSRFQEGGEECRDAPRMCRAGRGAMMALSGRGQARRDGPVRGR